MTEEGGWPWLLSVKKRCAGASVSVSSFGAFALAAAAAPVRSPEPQVTEAIGRIGVKEKRAGDARAVWHIKEQFADLLKGVVPEECAFP